MSTSSPESQCSAAAITKAFTKEAIRGQGRGQASRHQSKTLATITFQRIISRLYTKLSGMTGTALTEQDEFNSSTASFDMPIQIPTNKPLARIDQHDWVFKTEQAKFNAVINEIISRSRKGLSPVLVGTISIEKSEMLSNSRFPCRGIKHAALERQVSRKTSPDNRPRRLNSAPSPSPPTWPDEAPT